MSIARKRRPIIIQVERNVTGEDAEDVAWYSGALMLHTTGIQTCNS